jgi:hypothetical protein
VELSFLYIWFGQNKSTLNWILLDYFCSTSVIKLKSTQKLQFLLSLNFSLFAAGGSKDQLAILAQLLRRVRHRAQDGGQGQVLWRTHLATLLNTSYRPVLKTKLWIQELGLMLWSQFLAKIWRFSQKTNVKIKFLHNLALSWVKNINFPPIVLANIFFKNHNIRPWQSMT